MAKFYDSELLRLLTRNCQNDAALVRRVVSVCNGTSLEDAETASVILKLKDDVELMEKEQVSIDELRDRITKIRIGNAFVLD
jgi:hypothetical protein